MAFRRTVDPRFSADVKVPVPKEGGGYQNNTFKAIFSKTTTDEQAELRKLSNEELVRRKLVGWELTDDETKESVPFTPENMEAILQIAPSPIHIATAFWETVSGARAKNS